MKKIKFYTDILSILLLLTALVTGLVLHKNIHHYNTFTDHSLFFIHSLIGIGLLIILVWHVWQHKPLFKNYSKIQKSKKRVTTILDIVGLISFVLGFILMSGGLEKAISILHFIFGIGFTVLMLGHVAKRWKTLKSLFK